MDFDQDKVDEMTLALLHLTTSETEKVPGARAWKGFDWATMSRLYEKGWIGDPKSKAASVFVTEDGVKQSKELFLKHFGKRE